MNVRFYLSHHNKNISKSHFGRENVKILRNAILDAINNVTKSVSHYRDQTFFSMR